MAGEEQQKGKQPQQEPEQQQQQEPGQQGQQQQTPAESSAIPSSVGILPAEHWQEQEINRADDDADSALGTDTESSTASLTSSIYQYRELHGRRFHSETGNAIYWASNDEAANEAMDINHHTLSMAMDDRIYMAPLKKEDVKAALDIGTGTGIWAIDFADEFPEAEVIGTDISPIQPTWVPPNLKFEIEDCTQEWTFHRDHFDYVHLRWLVGSVPDWDALMQNAFKVCSPGGYVESLETSARMASDDGTVSETCAMGQWGKFFIEGGKKLGRSFTVLEDGTQRKAMEAAGFVDIEEFDFKMPIGGWPKDPKKKELGQFAQMVLERDIEGYVLFMANTLGWARDEILVYVGMLRRELHSQRFHAYYRQKVVWGRKPASS